MAHWDQLDYEGIGGRLHALGVSGSAAESHGVLCGLLCGRGYVDSGYWITELRRADGVKDRAPDSPAAELTELHSETVRRINDPEFDFRLLIPDDAEPLIRRADALGEWCQGFLYGLGLGGARGDTGLPESVTEITHDLAEISKATAAAAGSEEDESSFVELVEYIRVGILVIHAELQARPARRDGPLH